MRVAIAPAENGGERPADEGEELGRAEHEEQRHERDHEQATATPARTRPRESTASFRSAASNCFAARAPTAVADRLRQSASSCRST